MSDESKNWTTAEFVQNWFDALSGRAPVDEILGFVVDDGLEMVFPDTTMHNHAEVRNWYAQVGQAFSDQTHTVEEVLRRDHVEHVDLDVTVVWEARQTSDGSQLKARAHQSWRLVPGPAPAGQLIERYRVVSLDPI